MLAASALVLPPVLLIAFEPDGTRHPMMHQLRSLLAVWLYTVGVVVLIHAVTELSARWLGPRWPGRVHQGLGVILALLAVLVISIPIAPVLASVCPGIAGHETDLVLRGTMLGAIYAVVGLALGHSQRAFLESRLSVERAQRAEAEARLAAVTARTQPHFLANALNTIAASVREDPARAEDLIERLGGLFSHALGAAGQTEVALLDELSAAKSYLVVQAARFGDRLTFEVEVAGELADDEAQRVPVMSIVPLVENAVLHGLSVPGTEVRVRLAIEVRGSDVSIEVSDDGPGPKGSRHEGHGTALRELNERLRLVYGEGRASVSLVREGEQTVARLRVPRTGGSR
jgi:two-component system sensor histidine kinase AlgZ